MDGDMVAVIPPPSKTVWVAAAIWSRSDGLERASTAGVVSSRQIVPATSPSLRLQIAAATQTFMGAEPAAGAGGGRHPSAVDK